MNSQGPYRANAKPPEPPPPRVSWLAAFRLWWRNRRCWQGEHAIEFEAMRDFSVRLRCARCGLVRGLVGHGPLAFRAIEDWRTP